MHVFTDASEKGFGAAVYLRAEGETGLVIGLLIAKARVAPIKFLTIPRLELQGAVAGLCFGEIKLQAVGVPAIASYVLDGFDYGLAMDSLPKIPFSNLCSQQGWGNHLEV